MPDDNAPQERKRRKYTRKPRKTTEYQREEKESAEKNADMMVNFATGDPAVVKFDQNVIGLEKLSEKLNETQKKILGVILTDFADDPESEPELRVWQKLRASCQRAGMAGSIGDQIKFYSTVADPQFIQVVRAVGSGLIGVYIVPVVARVVKQALEGDKTSQRWILQISGVMPDKYEFYMNRYQLTHKEVNIGELNLEGKSDDELKRMLLEVEYADAQEIVSN